MCLYKIALTGFFATSLAVEIAMAETPTSDTAKPAAAKKSTSDPTTSAFRLPHGAKLNTKQQDQYDKLKAKYDSTLHEAMDLLASKDPKDKNKGMKLNRDTRAAIRAEIKDIVSPSQNDQQAASISGRGSNSQQSTGSNSGYAPSGGYTNNAGPPMGGSYPMMPGGGMTRGGGGNCPPGGRR